jgi:D-3-phosphoglycerate dehydrogenase
LIGGDKPRLVDVQGISVEAEFGSHMLYIRNWDKPGFIGSLGSLLGESGVNIATFHLGRSARGEEAIALVEIDEALDDPLLASVRDLPHVVRADALRFIG